ncbi:SLBB domain-containing protein [Devosia sp. 1566]|uniref:SLBB domain-containing protein n=1 Tax=Devosia sp. 1566 TaxID=2499144 RepID=UPI000FD80D8A|nr:SLBB domain-containing protein [Devosia sp. 1566]
MLNLHDFSLVIRRRMRLAVLLAGVSLASAAMAAPAPLAPLTKLRISVVQFVAATGDYKRWDAVSGEFVIGPDGSLAVPTLGSMDVSGLSAEDLGTRIGELLQTELGLLDAPNASVQVLEYPPVYVVGNVEAPGAYSYRPGMTVIQAMALAGGEQRIEGASGLSETIKLQWDLEGYNRDILRTTTRLARLKAEFAREPEITFDPMLNSADPVVAEIMEQERRIFDAHTNELLRQQIGLEQLAVLYKAEIDALEQKSGAIDQQIERAQQQVDSLKTLLAAGASTVARLTDAERILDDLRSDKLDNVIATMSARENLNRSERDLAKLQDEQQSYAAAQLQEQQATLEKLMLNQTATMRMLRQSMDFDANATLAQTAKTGISYSILRQEGEQTVSLDASEASVLVPGDLVRVALEVQLPGRSPAQTPGGTAAPVDLAIIP